MSTGHHNKTLKYSHSVHLEFYHFLWHFMDIYSISAITEVTIIFHLIKKFMRKPSPKSHSLRTISLMYCFLSVDLYLRAKPSL